MKHLSESLSKSIIKKLKKYTTYYIIFPASIKSSEYCNQYFNNDLHSMVLDNESYNYLILTQDELINNYSHFNNGDYFYKINKLYNDKEAVLKDYKTEDDLYEKDAIRIEYNDIKKLKF